MPHTTELIEGSPGPAPSHPAAPAPLQRIRSYFASRLSRSIITFVLVAMVVVFSVLSPYFFTVGNLFQILLVVSVVGIMAAGQTYVIVTGGIDLSQSGTVGLAGVVGALLMTGSHGSILYGVLGGLAVGLAVGLLNAALVTALRLPPFIATLGSVSVAEGLAFIVTGGQPVFGIPQPFADFGSGGIAGFLPYIAIVMLVVVVVLHMFLSRSRTGRYTYAIGSNTAAARLAGVPVRRNLVKAYVVSALTSAVAALVLLAWTDSGVAAAGDGRELQSIAAVVIGGGSLAGGEGTVVGSLIGALLMAVLGNGTQLLHVSSYLQQVLQGVVVIGAVYMDTWRRSTHR